MKLNTFTTEQTDKKDQTFSLIIDEIIAICKEDERFFDNSKINKIEDDEVKINEKIKKKMNLLLKSDDLKEDITKKLKMIDQEIFNKRSDLLERLGSEL